MELKAGYKLTEVGVIPEDWDCNSLSTCGTFSKGQGIRKDEAKSGDIPCIRYGEIYTHHNDVVHVYNSHISRTVAKTSKRIAKGDVLFAGSGETKAEIGKAVAFLGCEEVYASGDIVIFSPRNQSAAFLGYLLNAPIVVRQKASRGQGDAVVHISARALGAVCIPCPPLAEQQAIAEALSDADALIESLNQLITKKRNLKQAAMQQLLTGQIQLSGFSGVWEVKRLGDVLKVRHGKSQHEIVIPGGIYPILATGGEIGRTNVCLYDKPSVLIGRKGTIDKPQFQDSPFWTVDTLFFTELFNSVNPKFIYFKFLMIDWRSYNEASGVPSLNAATIENIEVSIPMLEEQTAIATILSDIDTELAELESRLAKALYIKQGMMQELLTGRIRLV